jgi:hypothetical protein
MGRNQRIGFAALAVLIALVAVVLIGGREDERTERADAEPTLTATPSASPEGSENGDAKPTPTPAETPRPRPRSELVSYRGGEAAGGVKRLEFKQGETARFSIASDVAEEIHVHGYDLYRDVPAGGRARFAFQADIEGIFEVEMHGSAVQVAELRVEP